MFAYGLRCAFTQLALLVNVVLFLSSHVAASRDVTYTAIGGGIVVWRRARPITTIRWKTRVSSVHIEDSNVCALLAISELLVAAHSDGFIRVWHVAVDSDAASCIATLQQEIALPNFVTPTVLVHPDTYLNKVAVGTSMGSVCIVNIRSGRVVHECKVAPSGVAVTALAQVSGWRCMLRILAPPRASTLSSPSHCRAQHWMCWE